MVVTAHNKNQKPGHKQTEVGEIPEIWEVKSIGDVITDFRGGAPLTPNDFTRNGVKVLPKGGVVRGGRLRIQENEQQYCSQKYAEAHKSNQVNNLYTIVVLRDLVPSGPSIGLMVKIEDSDSFVLAQGVYGFKVSQDKANPEYLIQYSNGFNYRKLMNSIMVGSTQVHITNTALKKALLPFPPLPEQQAIAAVLSDVDALIASLDRLIAKKRNIKQATMQQLLTGKTRLPGFSGKLISTNRQTEVGMIPEDWDVHSVEEIADVTTGDKDTQDKTETGTYPFFVRSQIVERINSYSYDGEAVLTAGDGVGVGKVFHYAIGKFDFHQRVYMIYNFRQFDGFFFYLYFSNNFYKEATKYNAKNSVDSVRREMVTGMKIPCPPLPEQQAIAAVFSDMDAEIAALEQRRDKMRALKQGMMQELLTGKTRLI